MTVILLVGEGDFSFSVSFLQQNNPICTKVVSTSLLSEYEVYSLHKHSEENVRQIKNAGGEVIFNVDATQLHRNADIIPFGKFNVIIFNFPHTGGKSNIKRNRQLLNSFFLSAKQVLAQEGQVRVALACGQGGTPADKPCREWQNSWQIVAMAADANLILHRTEDFNSSSFPEYNSSGFRSQDKHFRTENAVIHVFVRTYSELGHECNVKLSPKQLCVLNNQEYWFGKYVSDKISRINNALTHEPHHPLNIINARLQDITRKIFGCDATISDELPRIVCNSDGAIPHFRGIPIEMCDKEFEKHLYLNFSECYSAFLRTSLLENLSIQEESDRSGVKLYVGDVYKPCQISENECPLDIEVIIVNHGKLIDFENMARSVIEELLCDSIPNIQCGETIKTGTHGTWVVAEWVVTAPIDLQNQDCVDVNSGDFNASDIVALYGHLNSSPNTSVLLISFLSLAKILYKLTDPRILWTRDARYYEQFATFPAFLAPRPYSMYPPSWTFDISFWINDKYDTQIFFNLCRDVCGDNIVSVHLIDKFYEGKSDRVSLCYRLLFQSCDKASSYSLAYDVQQLLRIEVASCLLVELR